jgi:hypothetical protein
MKQLSLFNNIKSAEAVIINSMPINTDIHCCEIHNRTGFEPRIISNVTWKLMKTGRVVNVHGKAATLRRVF